MHFVSFRNLFIFRNVSLRFFEDKCFDQDYSNPNIQQKQNIQKKAETKAQMDINKSLHCLRNKNESGYIVLFTVCSIIHNQDNKMTNLFETKKSNKTNRTTKMKTMYLHQLRLLRHASNLE